MEGQATTTPSSERRQPLIDKDEAKELALGIARLVEARGEPPKKTLVDSDELARQVDADFTCFLCRKRCRTKSRFLTHFRSHFKAAGIGSSRKRRRLDNNNDDNSSMETSDDETSNDDESLKEEPVHLRGVDNSDHAKVVRQQRRKKRNLKSDPRLSKRSRNPLLSTMSTGGSSMDPDGDSGCHSIDDDAGSTSSSSTYSICSSGSNSAFSDCPGDSESSESECGENLPGNNRKSGLPHKKRTPLVSVKDRLSLAEKQLDNNETEGLICLTCLKRFSNCQNLRRHLRLHIARDSVTPDIEKAGGSSQCDASDDADFDGRYFCDWCPARFDNRSAARVHENSHKGQETKCYICDKSYADRYSLRYHLRTHGIGRQIRCEYCNKSFSKPSRLEAHVRAQHDNIRDFDCLQCGKKFKTRVHLGNHARRHSGERPFACSVCEDRFRHKASLIAHMRSHVGSRPYCCEVCGKTFREPSTLKAHCRVHTGDKPYRCGLCDKSFTQRAGLNYHKKSHEAGQLHEMTTSALKSTTTTAAATTTMPSPLPSPPIQSGDAVFQMSPLPSFDHLKSSSSPSSSPSSSSMSSASDTFSYSMEKSVTSSADNHYTRDVTPPQTPPASTTASSCSPPMSTTTSLQTSSASFALSPIEEEDDDDLLPALNISEITHQLDFTETQAQQEDSYYGKNYTEEQSGMQLQHYRHQVCQHQQQLLQQQQHQQQQWFQHPYHMQHHDLHQTSSSTSYSSSSYESYAAASAHSYEFSNTSSAYPLLNNPALHQHHQHVQQQQQHHNHHQQQSSMDQNHFNAFGANGYNGNYGHQGTVATVAAALAASVHGHQQPAAGYCL